MVCRLSAWIDEPRNMPKWIGTIWPAWHGVQRGGNELPSMGGSLISLKWLFVSSPSCSLLHCWLEQTPSLWSSRSFQLTPQRAGRLWLQSRARGSAHWQMCCSGCCWPRLRFATQNTSQLVRSWAPWQKNVYVCSCYLACCCHSHLFELPSCHLLPLFYPALWHYSCSGCQGGFCWQVRRGCSFWHEQGSKFFAGLESQRFYLDSGSGHFQRELKMRVSVPLDNVI